MLPDAWGQDLFRGGAGEPWSPASNHSSDEDVQWRAVVADGRRMDAEEDARLTEEHEHLIAVDQERLACIGGDAAQGRDPCSI